MGRAGAAQSGGKGAARYVRAGARGTGPGSGAARAPLPPPQRRRGPGRDSPSGLDKAVGIVPSAPSFKSQDNPGSERGGEQTESQSMPPLGISRIAPSWEGQKPDQGSVLPLLPLEADARETGGE